MYTKSQPPYPNKFKPGDTAVATQDIDFCDNTKHVTGQQIVVTEDTVSYYNVWHTIYEKA